MVPTKSRYSSRRTAARAAARPQPLGDLLSLGDGHGWIVSCYQKLEPADRMNEKYRIKLKNRLRRAAERLDILGHDHGEREAIKAALGRIEQFFSHPSNLDGGRGMAVFAGDDFFRAVPLPYVLKSRVLVDRTPVVGELVALSEARPRVLVAAVDRRSARFFDVLGGAATELPGIPAQASRTSKYHGDADAPGWGEFKFHTRIREEKHRHLARVAETIAARLRSERYDGLLIGGIGVEATALERHLHPSVAGRIPVGTVTFTPKQVTPAEVARCVNEFLDDQQRAHAGEDVARLAEALGTGWAVDGVEPTLQALHRGQVSALVVDHDAEVPGFRMSKSGRLTTGKSSSSGEGDPLPVADVLDDAIEDALRQRARVAVVRGEPARGFRQLAGFLRFQTS